MHIYSFAHLAPTCIQIIAVEIAVVDSEEKVEEEEKVVNNSI